MTAPKTAKTLLSMTALLSALAGACGGDDSSADRNIDAGGLDASTTDSTLDAAPTASGKLFVVPTEIYGADFDNSTSFVPVVTSLDVQQIALNTAREVNGRASIGTAGKYFFLASSSAPVVNRFEIDEQGQLKEAGTLNFMNYGVPEFFAIDAWGAQFISPTKAYVFNGSDGSHVIWNPSTLEITGEIAAPPGIVREGYSLESVAMVRGNRMYRIFTILNYDSWDFLASPQYLAVYDLDNDTLLSVSEESRCPQLYSRPFLDEQGDIYFSGYLWTAVISVVKDYPKSCALRVKAGQDTFDPSYKLDFATQVTGGRQAAGLRYLGNGKALLDVFYSERATITSTTDPEELANTPNWRLWSIDLATGVGAPLEGLDFKAGGYQDVLVDARTFLMVPDNDYTETTAYEVANNKAVPGFKIRGSAYDMARVR